MLNRPFYQTTIAFLSLLAFAGGIAMLLDQGKPAGVVIAQPTATAGAATPTAEPHLGAPDPEPEKLLNLNTATAVDLVALPGVGPVLSERIVAYREANGPYQRTDQLMAVAGIGPATYEAVRDLITVGD
jgi:competence protein ComEA